METYLKEYFDWLEVQAKARFAISDDELVECEVTDGVAILIYWKMKHGKKDKCRKCHCLSQNDFLRIIALYADSEVWKNSLKIYSEIYKKHFS